ncbi:unnamed protein product [Brachionus calyciflorus]|uniref:MULE transposase domain-containing protein n=1 Tax=Brachionus calyciflorus TaxID=104777 RepID=A0A814AP39_9BILA|nr:unnamed protein product [Brachionus calyciflorus]
MLFGVANLFATITVHWPSLKISWRCIDKNCRGGCYTYTDKFGESCEVWVTNSEHIDIPDPTKFVNLEHYDALRQVINRSKDKVKPDYPIEPTCLKSFEFPQFLTKTIQTSFLRWDITPKPFNQVYSIHALDNGQCLVEVYCLLPRKSQKLYERVWSKIKEALEGLPLSITCDFEKAFINACVKIFPGMKSMLISHPLVYALVDAFRREQKLISNRLLKVNTGVVYRRKPAYDLLDERIRNA